MDWKGQEFEKTPGWLQYLTGKPKLINEKTPCNIWEDLKMFDVAIIGAGPAGASAALFTARS